MPSSANEDSKLIARSPADTTVAPDRTPMVVARSKTNPFRAFYRGLTTPSGLSIVIAVALATATLIYGYATIDEEWVFQNSHLLSSSATHEQDSVTRGALELRLAKSARPAVILIGSKPTKADLNRFDPIAFSGDSSTAVYDLRTSSQSIWETLAICDQIPLDTLGRLVLYLNSASLKSGSDEAIQLDRHPRFGFRSASLAVELQKLGKSTVPIRNVYFLDNYSYLLRRLPMLVSNSISVDHARVNQEMISDNQSFTPDGLSPANSRSEENLALNLSVLDNMLKRLRTSRLLELSIVFDDWSVDADDNEAETKFDLQILDQVRSLADRQEIELITATDSHS